MRTQPSANYKRIGDLDLQRLITILRAWDIWSQKKPAALATWLNANRNGQAASFLCVKARGNQPNSDSSTLAKVRCVSVLPAIGD